MWMEQVEDRAIVDMISYTTLRQRGLEMKDCQHVDPQFEFRYHNTVGNDVAVTGQPRPKAPVNLDFRE